MTAVKLQHLETREVVEAMQLTPETVDAFAAWSGGKSVTEQHPQEGHITFVVIPHEKLGIMIVMPGLWAVRQPGREFPDLTFSEEVLTMSYEEVT